jgi:hypothetical protein
MVWVFQNWDWVFQNKDIIIDVVRHSRGMDVVTGVLNRHRSALSDLYRAQQGHTDQWQVCLAYQLRDGQFAIEAGQGVCLTHESMALARCHSVAPAPRLGRHDPTSLPPALRTRSRQDRRRQ